MSNSDAMIDLETLATSTDAAILTIGAVRFDPFGKDIQDPAMTSLYLKIDQDSCDELGLRVDDATVEWWSKQSKETQDEVFGSTDLIHIKNAFEQLYKFCWGAKRVWSNGSVFDIMICEHIFAKIGKAVPWQFWEIRDVRTVFDLGINPNRPPVMAHHALQDAWNQAVGVQNVYNALRGATLYDGKNPQPFYKER